MAEHARFQLGPFEHLGVTVGREEQSHLGVALGKSEGHVLGRGPAAPTRLARIQNEEGIARVEQHVLGVGRDGLDDGPLDELSVDAAIFEVDGAASFLDVAVACVDEVEGRLRTAFARGLHSRCDLPRRGFERSLRRRLGYTGQLRVGRRTCPVERRQQGHVIRIGDRAEQTVVAGAVVIGVLQVGHGQGGATIVGHHQREGSRALCRERGGRREQT